jgi:large subunit ribosomal protein L25
MLQHNEVLKHLEHEAFYSHILSVNVGGQVSKAVLRDVQRHPAKPVIMHMDFMRVDENQAIRVHVPLHFTGEEVSPGVKAGGAVSHDLVEIEVEVLPRHLPEFVEVDLSGMNVGDTIHLSGLKLPESCALVELMRGESHDLVVVSMHAKRGGAAAEDEGEAGAEAGEAES